MHCNKHIKLDDGLFERLGYPQLARRLRSRQPQQQGNLRSDVVTGADPGFFLGGGALVPCSTSTPINHMVFLQNTSCIRKPQVISRGEGGGCAPPAPSP